MEFTHQILRRSVPMPVYKCYGCHPRYPCILEAEGVFPIPNKCPWGLDDRCKWIEEADPDG